VLHKISQMLSRIPLIGPIFCFPFAVSQQAAFQLLFLWLLSSIPLLLSVGLSVAGGSAFRDALISELNINAIYLYTAAFLAPVLYMNYERLVYPKNEKIFQGAGWVFLASIAILSVSAFSFNNENSSMSAPQYTPAFTVYLSFTMYGLSILFWFFSIADSRLTGGSYADIVNSDTENFVARTKNLR